MAYFGRTSANPLPKRGRIALLAFDELSAEDAANLQNWTIAGTGYANRTPALCVDRAAGTIRLTSRSKGLVLFLK